MFLPIKVPQFLVKRKPEGFFVLCPRSAPGSTCFILTSLHSIVHTHAPLIGLYPSGKTVSQERFPCALLTS